MKLLWQLTVFAFLALVSFASDENTQTPKKTFFGLEVRANVLGALNYIPLIRNIPLSIRQIPCHKDDACNPYWHPNRIVTIPFDTLSPGTLNAFDLAIVPQITLKEKYRFKAGPSWMLPFYFTKLENYIGDQDELTRGDIREINLGGGTHRGTGASLVYYATRSRAILSPGMFAEFDVKIYGPLVLTTGFSFRKYRLDIEKGYDRYNSLEKLPQYQLSTNYSYSPYVGVKLEWVESESSPYAGKRYVGSGGFVVFAGPIFSRYNLMDSQFDGVEIHFKKYLVIGGGIFARWDFRKRE